MTDWHSAVGKINFVININTQVLATHVHIQQKNSINILFSKSLIAIHLIPKAWSEHGVEALWTGQKNILLSCPQCLAPGFCPVHNALLQAFVLSTILAPGFCPVHNARSRLLSCPQCSLQAFGIRCILNNSYCATGSNHKK